MRRHELDLLSLLSGLVLLAVAAAFLLGQATGRSVDGTWALPVTLIALGLAGIAGGVGRAARRRPEPVGPVLPPDGIHRATDDSPGGGGA